MNGTVSRHLRTSAAIGAIAVTGVLASEAMAQGAPGDELFDLGTITITAGGFTQNVTDAPASVTVVTGDELRKTNVTTLSDALREVQGVTTTGVANEKDIKIRGLPGDYTLILVDGKRQGTRESRTNGSAGFEQSFIPPMAAIERIEIVRGPMSSLYGSDAMGGVINIITKKVTPVWTGSVTAETRLPQNDDDPASRQLSFYLNGPIVQDKLGLQLWGRRLTSDESSILDGPAEQQDFDISGRLTWTPTDDHEIALEYGRTRIKRFTNPGYSLDPTADPDRQDNIRKDIALSYVGHWGTTTTELSFQREFGERTNYDWAPGYFVENPRSPEIVNSVVDGKVTTPFTLAGEHTFVGGFQFRRAELTDQNPGLGDGIDRTYASDEWAIFAEDEWRITSDFALTAGVRYTDSDAFGGEVTPRLYAVWNAMPELTIKGGISTGYRTPSIRQTVPGYYYTTQRGAGVIVSNADLKPESSTNYELSALWQSGNFEFGATAFRTEFEDKIENFNTGIPITVAGTTYNRWEYYNVQDATIQGVELTLGVDLSEAVSLRGSYTFTDSSQDSGTYAGLPLSRTPKHAASLRLDWTTPVSGLDAWGVATYHGAEVNSGARIGSNGTPYAYDSSGGVIAYEYDPYTTLDVGLSYQVNPNLVLNAAIYNVANASINASDNNTYQSGRTYWFGLTSSF
ncbi:outer membrane receptor for ferrienterochelin and colicins [Lutimaribacter pacificus]|uniref:Outer membrane receptor for ferrienterochelin and colicins n=1 Tax=Lutimaribacter pacificus TaxID=391948 RepID=A0A1H0BYH5_9RHOB|nr:TonB-dependent receptor [Lutimaribacter pacificus]SDN50632.1 outer membrane receptor for ferrienterochelin and colicins [Lutimaribacter pacificus]SHJ50935.1 outer membrane receptor for ferrienterochelin and colicins [Lutimaribacter pacificus]